MSFENPNVPQPEIVPNNPVAPSEARAEVPIGKPEEQSHSPESAGQPKNHESKQETGAPTMPTDNEDIRKSQEQRDQQKIKELRKQLGVDESPEGDLPNSSTKKELPPIPKNPYEILGIKPGASKNEIRSAFRKKVSEYHPDLHENSSLSNEWLIAIQEARDKISGQGNVSNQTPSQYQNPKEAFNQQEENFWRSKIRGGYESVWTENTTFWKWNEKDLKKNVESRIINRDGLIIQSVHGIYDREFLLDPETKNPISAEYTRIFINNGLLIGKRPNLVYLLDKNGRQLSEGFFSVEIRGVNIIGTKNSPVDNGVEIIMSVDKYNGIN